jgi:hypothetical protein
MKRYIKSAVLNIIDSDIDTQLEVARTSEDPEVLADLVNSRFTDVQLEVAKNPNISLDVLDALSRKGVRVREAVAKNPNISENIMWRLLKDKGGYVSYTMIRNLGNMKNLSTETIRRLLTDKSLSFIDTDALRNSIARHPNTPKGILARLLKTKNADKDRSYMTAIQNPNFPADKIRELYDKYKSEDSLYGNNVLYAISRSPNAPADILLELWDIDPDRGWLVPYNVVANPNTPEDFLHKIYSNLDSTYDLALAENPNCPTDILRDILRRGANQTTINLIHKQLLEREQ